MKEIEEEIRWYQVNKSVAECMRKLGKMGFEPTGHGYCLIDHGEDFEFDKKHIWVNICSMSKKTIVSISV